MTGTPATATPWNSIAESVPAERGALPITMSEARESPCATCSTAPCCTHLPLTTFQVTNLVELDHAAYLLNFDRIELGISANGEWSVYYTQPCRFLDRGTFGCTVHNTPQQPQICVHYNPYNCWYKRAFNTADSTEFVRLDQERFALLAAEIAFDEDRRIVSVPAWEEIVAMMAGHEDRPKEPVPEPSTTDPMIERWLAGVTQPETAAAPPPEQRSFDDFRDACAGCDAYCCTTLVFPQSVPTHVSNFDYFRFVLGFPGVELVIGEQSWSVAVRTTCRYLDRGRCSIYGQPERPLLCKYYDATKCDYKPQFGVPRPDHVMRVRLEQYETLLAGLGFAEDGTLSGLPPFEALRASIETSCATANLLPLVAR